jgi:AraC-like DNA-binding protein
VLHDPAAADALGRLVTALLAGAEPLETHTLFLAACTHLLRRHTVDRPPCARSGRPRPTCAARASTSRRTPERRVALADLARVAGLHPLYLVRAFRAAVGLPPHAYLTQTRVRWAKRLLGAGEPPAAVAARVGFVDQSHLTRHFKRLVGVPPGQYARAVRADTHRRAARD